MKIAVIGSRTFINKKQLYGVLDSIQSYEPTISRIDVIISGGAKGADTYAEHYVTIPD